MRTLWTVVGIFAFVGATSWAEERAERFDKVVREDLFAGFGGDDEALSRGMKKCEEALAKNPKHAEAMVWRGAGRVFQSGQAFQKKDFITGMQLWTAGLKDMDDAIALEPKNIS